MSAWTIASSPLCLPNRKSDPRTHFICADGSQFVADQPPDAVVMNEVIYYLPDPIGAVMHHARQLATGGVVIISIYARTWSSRRLLRAIAAAAGAGGIQACQVGPSGLDGRGVSTSFVAAEVLTGGIPRPAA